MSNILTDHPIIARLTWRAFRWAHHAWRRRVCLQEIWKAESIRDLSDYVRIECGVYAPAELEELRIEESWREWTHEAALKMAIERVALCLHDEIRSRPWRRVPRVYA
jgi:hypothetical protein